MKTHSGVQTTSNATGRSTGSRSGPTVSSSPRHPRAAGSRPGRSARAGPASATMSRPAGSRRAAFSPDGRKLAAAGQINARLESGEAGPNDTDANGLVIVFDLETGRGPLAPRGHDDGDHPRPRLQPRRTTPRHGRQHEHRHSLGRARPAKQFASFAAIAAWSRTSPSARTDEGSPPRAGIPRSSSGTSRPVRPISDAAGPHAVGPVRRLQPRWPSAGHLQRGPDGPALGRRDGTGSADPPRTYRHRPQCRLQSRRQPAGLRGRRRHRPDPRGRPRSAPDSIARSLTDRMCGLQ